MKSQVCTAPPSGPARVYPFSAIVGQELMKLALILNAIEPRTGGVLIRGEKGTAKSTAVRGLAALLPPLSDQHRCGCVAAAPELDSSRCGAVPLGWTAPRRSAPVVTLPLNATEDMVLGGLDFSATLRRGKPVFQPGLLARAHGGILYVDEVNLLDDHLVDIILDAAASGVNVVEREGTTLRHDARFTLVGTMNPEEGDLRPQLLERFGLCVEVGSEQDMEMRVELVERRCGFELDSAGFCHRFEHDEAELSSRLARAREVLPSVRMERRMRSIIGELTRSRNVAGHRADLVIERAASAHAAWNGRRVVAIEDVLAVAEMALIHRGRDALPPPPPPPPQPEPEQEEQNPEQQQQDEAQQPEELDAPHEESSAPPGEQQGPPPEPSAPNPASVPPQRPERQTPDQQFEVGPTFAVKKLVPPDDRLLRRGSGRRSRTRTSQKQGRYVRSRLEGDGRDLALDATLRAAAPHQARRREGSTARTAVIIRRQDWREKVREKRVGCFILFVVDASGSMGARGRMAASKGAILSLLLDAYQKRDRVGMIAFRRNDASVILPPTSSIELAAKLLKDLAVGGRTPLSAGLSRAYELLRVQLRRDPNLRPLAIVITDGKSNVSLGSGSPMDETLRLAGRIGDDRRIHWIVVDTEEPGVVHFELAQRLAGALGAEYFRIDGLRAADLVNVVKGHSS